MKIDDITTNNKNNTRNTKANASEDKSTGVSKSADEKALPKAETVTEKGNAGVKLTGFEAGLRALKKDGFDLMNLIEFIQKGTLPVLNFLAKPKIKPESNVVVRPWCESDREAVIAMISARYEEVGAKLNIKGVDEDLVEVNYYWRKAGGEFMVLERDGKVVGSIAARPIADHARAAQLDRFFLLPEAEGKGISLHLLKWALEWCLSRQIRVIELWTKKKRWWAHKIYKKLGFEHNGVIKEIKGTAAPYYLMYFELPLYKMDSQKALKILEERLARAGAK